MSVIEQQRFIMALNGEMIGNVAPTALTANVLDPLKDVLKRDLNVMFDNTKHAPAPDSVPPASAHKAVQPRPETSHPASRPAVVAFATSDAGDATKKSTSNPVADVGKVKRILHL